MSRGWEALEGLPTSGHAKCQAASRRSGRTGTVCAVHSSSARARGEIELEPLLALAVVIPFLPLPGLKTRPRTKAEPMSLCARGTLLASLLSLQLVLHAENRFFVQNATLPAGAIGEQISLRLDTDEPVKGFAVALKFDPTVVRVTAVSKTDTIAEEAEYFAGKIDGATGALGYGCIFSFNPGPTAVLPPGANRGLVDLVVDVVGAAGTTSDLIFEDVEIDPNPVRPPVTNMLTNEGGLTVVPALTRGTLSIEDRTPRITSIVDNEGHAGKVFRLVGDFFSEPGLAVKVCDVTASFTLEPDGHTLKVTAPNCGSLGFTPVEICTVRGCDSRSEGFRYLPIEETPFIRGDSDGDTAVNITDAIVTLRYLFLGGEPALCVDAMDANDDGRVDVSDASYELNFLFLGGPDIPAPYPVAGRDPTEDLLPGC